LASSTVNPLIRPSNGYIPLLPTTADKELKLPVAAERPGDLSSRTTRPMASRKPVLEENLSGNQSNKERLGSLSEEN
jgi:hypothetical protein